MISSNKHFRKDFFIGAQEVREMNPFPVWIIPFPIWIILFPVLNISSGLTSKS